MQLKYGNSELLLIVGLPLHYVGTSLQCKPCCRIVHIFALHNLQVQQMMSNSSAGAVGLSVSVGR